MGTFDKEIALLAGRQQTQVARAQLLAIGLDRWNIAHRLKVGRLYPNYRGVYSVGRPAINALERASAAVLACGAGAALSHGSAMSLWDFKKGWDTPFEVTVPKDRRIAGIKIHRSRTLARRDVTTQRGIRVTTPARTILDHAPRLTDAALTRAVNDGRHSGFLKLSALADVIERYPRHPGAPRVRKVLTGSGPGPTRADWEDALPAFCKRRGLPDPVMAAKVCGHTVDALFPAEKLIIELDSWDFHCDRAAFETDRDRDADTLAAGYGTVRITWVRIHETPDKEAARLHVILANRRALLARDPASAPPTNPDRPAR